MSYWTHINGSIVLDTYLQESNEVIHQQVQEVIDKAPKVTGSESDMQIFINHPEGHNWSTNMDCLHCEYFGGYDMDKSGHNRLISCAAEEDFECPEGEFQTIVVLTLYGDLRDRTIKETKAEVDAFVKYIEKIYSITRKNIKLTGK